MDDLEITKACALAMGGIATELPDFEGLWLVGNNSYSYDPLTNDAQAMALVKRFGLHITRLSSADWSVVHFPKGKSRTDSDAIHAILNAAICECVARLPAAQQPEGQK